MVNPPFKYNDTEWITVPPQGYGGIQWIIKNIIDGLLEMGYKITLLGAPGSPSCHPNLDVPSISDEENISDYLNNLDTNIIVHDHTSRGIEFSKSIRWNQNHFIIHSHYLTSKPLETKNLVAASYAHAHIIGYPSIPVIRHPVNPDNYQFCDKKDDYLLYLGRISSWKGAHTAARFARKAGCKLIMAGPAWEGDYFNSILQQFKSTVEYVGEVGGTEKQQLLSRATATLVFSGGIHEPTGLEWVEPGSQVVSESAVSGTPVISSENGCLKEIVPLVGQAIKNPNEVSEIDVEKILTALPKPIDVRNTCLDEWNYLKIAQQYACLYQKIQNGVSW